MLTDLVSQFPNLDAELTQEPVLALSTIIVLHTPPEIKRVDGIHFLVFTGRQASHETLRCQRWSVSSAITVITLA